MTLIEMFADSTHLHDLIAGITPDKELGQILLEAQITVNSFVASVGQNLRSTFIADTFMMFGEAFSTEEVKYFSICLLMQDSETRKQTSTVFPFSFVLVGSAVGLHFNG